MNAHPALAAALLVAGVGLATPAPAQPQLTIYRCTDAKGTLTLRDSPCRKGEKQETRSMLRPTDPPPHRQVATAPRPAVQRTDVQPALAPRVVYITPPRPTYECTTPDGERYTSESAEGNPRFVPLWTLGYPIAVAPEARGGYGGVVEYRDRNARVRIDGGRRWRVPGSTVVGPATAYVPAGTWVRDVCHALPPMEVCARLSDRRDALDRRYNSALQGERDAIVREQRGIDARLATECRA